MQTTLDNSCATIGSLAYDYYRAISLVNRKFGALQRLAMLLEEAGDLRGALPNLGALVPLYLIDLSVYNNLLAACPFLSLPAHPVQQDIAALQDLVATAYGRILGQYKQHPWARLGSLQEQMAKVQSKLNSILNIGTQAWQCLQQACASAQQISSLINPTDFQDQLDQYQKTYVATNQQVLNESMRQKYDTAQSGINQLNELLSAKPFTPEAGQVIPDLGRPPVIPQAVPQPPPAP